MTRVLLTSFEAFDGLAVNSSLEVGRAVAAAPPPGVALDWQVLPVVASRCGRRAWERVEGAALVLALGQAAGAAALRLERRAVNLDDFSLPDNSGVRLCKMRIARDGPPAYPTTAPVEQLAQALQERGLPVELSDSAGAYVCNHLYYDLLHRAARSEAGHATLFVHVPLLPEQVPEAGRKKMPTRPLEELAEGVRLLIAAYVQAGERGVTTPR
jgi:pyroglutamyl-peptidase